MIRPLVELYSGVPTDERPEWMNELKIQEKDSFSYALRFAEESYLSMIRTSQNCDYIKDCLKSQLASKGLIHNALQSLSTLSSELTNCFSDLNLKYKEEKEALNTTKSR